MIEVVQKYNPDMYKKCARVLMKRMMTTMLVCGIIIVLMSILFYFEDVVDGLIFSALGIFFIAMYFLMPVIMIRANTKNKHLLQKFTFTPESVKVDVYNTINGENNPVQIASSICRYNNFYDVKEINGIVYLFLNKTMAYIIDSRSFPTEADKLMVLGYYKSAKHRPRAEQK